MSPASSYPNAAAALIGVDELVRALRESSVYVLDCRLERDYAQGHLEGALWLDVRGLRKGLSATNPDPAELARRLQAAGLGSDRPAVLYGDRLTYSLVGYAWWLLQYLGHPVVRVLHGGIEAWTDAGLALTDAVPEAAESVRFTLAVRRAWLTGSDEMDSARQDPHASLIDARSPTEHAQAHIGSPGANQHSLSHDEIFDAATGSLKSPETLAALFAPLDRETPLVAYCQSGARSATLLWALHAMGFDRLSNYYGSMQAWQAEGRPEATIELPGEDLPA